MVLQFGTHRGKEISKVPDSYLLWLAKPKYSDSFYKNIRSTELNWRVPIDVKNAARKEADRRGWILKGETWEKK